MFVFDSAEASKDWTRLVKQVQGVIEKHGGSVLSHQKWADRKLAYPIAKRKRGTYMLMYFTAPSENIASMRRDLHLMECVLRHLILVSKTHKPSGKKDALEQKKEVESKKIGVERSESLIETKETVASDIEPENAVATIDENLEDSSEEIR